MSVLSVVEILRDARGLITQVRNWNQEYYALTEEGHHVSVRDPSAYRFDAIGAVGRAIHGVASDEEVQAHKENGTSIYPADEWATHAASQYLYEVCAEIAGEDTQSKGVVAYNDSHTHQDVLEMFDFAITTATYAEGDNDDS